MTSIKRLFSVAGVLMVFVAIAAVASAGAGTLVPFRGMDTTATTFAFDMAGNNHFHIDGGGGYATQLGHFTVTEDTGTISADGAFSTSWAFVAANGDTLKGTATGSVTPLNPSLTRFALHTSGPIDGDTSTGRFAGASGTVTFDGVIIVQTFDPATSSGSATVNDTITGTISTVGSS